MLTGAPPPSPIVGADVYFVAGPESLPGSVEGIGHASLLVRLPAFPSSESGGCRLVFERPNAELPEVQIEGELQSGYDDERGALVTIAVRHAFAPVRDLEALRDFLSGALPDVASKWRHFRYTRTGTAADLEAHYRQPGAPGDGPASRPIHLDTRPGTRPGMRPAPRASHSKPLEVTVRWRKQHPGGRTSTKSKSKPSTAPSMDIEQMLGDSLLSGSVGVRLPSVVYFSDESGGHRSPPCRAAVYRATPDGRTFFICACSPPPPVGSMVEARVRVTPGTEAGAEVPLRAHAAWVLETAPAAGLAAFAVRLAPDTELSQRTVWVELIGRAHRQYQVKSSSHKARSDGDTHAPSPDVIEYVVNPIH